MGDENIVYVVYEMIPEETRLYRLVFDMDGYYKTVRCHGKIVNSDDMTDDMKWLMEILDQETMSEDVDGEFGWEAPITIDKKDVEFGRITIIYFGFML